MNNPYTPPAARTALGVKQTQVCQPGKLILQHCQDCGQVQYPYREVCKTCLSIDLIWKNTATTGSVCVSALLYHSLEPFFKARSPWLMGSIKLECGVLVYAHLHTDCVQPGARVQVINHIDMSGQAVLVALPDTAVVDQPDCLHRYLAALKLE